MTILPLAGRELRVRARSPMGYWTRFGAALAGILVCVPVLSFYPRTGLSPEQLGAMAFNGLVVAAFILCCFSGILTVDGISRERREGTLGLLFLTRVRVLDVLLGKFGAAGLAGLCALAAFVPVLIVPVLAGGVSGGEAARKVLALFDTMILSLAAGLWASARGREWTSSARAAAGLLVLVIFGPVLLGWFIPTALPLHLSAAGPLHALEAADDLLYRKTAAPYWISIAVVHAFSWLLVMGAGIRLRRALREEDETPGRKPLVEGEAPSGFMLADFEIKSQGRKPLAEGEAPLEWLLRRQRGVKAVVWAGALLGVALLFQFMLFPKFIGVWLFYSSWGMNLAVSAVEGCLFAWAASRFFIEARRTGELELLLTTPEGARTIVTSQWKWLKEVFLWPLIVILAPRLMGLAQEAVRLSTPGNLFPLNERLYYLTSHLLAGLNTFAGIVALLWAGMWFGWSARSHAKAIVRTVLVARGVPHVIGILEPMFYMVLSKLAPNTLYSNGRFDPWWFMIRCIPQMIILLFCLWLIQWAWRRLATELGRADGGSTEVLYHLCQKLAPFRS